MEEKLFQAGVDYLQSKKKTGDWLAKAIKCLQRAIVLRDNDHRFWQYLGEAYYQRGSLNSAINSFNKCLELSKLHVNAENDDEISQGLIHSRIRISDIRYIVGNLDEAATGYSEVLDKEPNNVSALLGLSRTNLAVANEYFKQGLVRLGYTHCMESLATCYEAIKQQPDSCTAWKLAADCCLIQCLRGQKFLKETDHLKASYSASVIRLRHELFGGHKIDRVMLLEFAQKFLCKAITLGNYKTNSQLWHNLGVCIWLRGIETDSLTSDYKAHMERSLHCLLKALSLNAKSSDIRNTIGVVSYQMKLLTYAQSFLAKSILVNESTSEMQFSNLGFIYMSEGRYDLAQAAFDRCTAEDPMLPLAWLGKAMIGNESDASNIRLLRHANYIGNLYEAQVLYATRLCDLLSTKRIAPMERDILGAIVSSEKAIHYDVSSSSVYNTLALLYERSGQISRARRYFREAYILSPQNHSICINYLRQLVADTKSCYVVPQGDIPKSGIDDLDRVLKTVTENLPTNSNKQLLINYILYLLRSKDYQVASPKLMRLLEILNPKGSYHEVNTKMSAQLLMGLVKRKLGEDYKSWLFKNIIECQAGTGQANNETIANLLCLVIFSLSTSESDLSAQITPDLLSHSKLYIWNSQEPFEELLRSSYGIWIRLTIFVTLFLQRETNYIWSLVRAFPMVPELWMLCGLSILMIKSNKKLSNAVFCLKKAQIVGASNSDVILACDLLLAIFNREDRRRRLSRAVYLCPSDISLRQALLDDRLVDLKNLFGYAIGKILKTIVIGQVKLV